MCAYDISKAGMMSANYVFKVKKGIHKVIYDKLYFNCSTFRKMHYEVSKLYLLLFEQTMRRP